MTSISPGRVCVKTAGRDAGHYCVIVSKIDDNFVEITGPKAISGIKRGRCNVSHLEPTSSAVEITDKAKDETIAKALEKEGIADGMKKRIALID